ncbi:MAG: hypothetical protein QOF21_551 [Actinomycetota bacterium]|jgi:plastocyanin
MRKFLIAVAAVGLLAGAACGSDSKKPDNGSTPTGGAAPTVQIKATGTTWEPDDVTIKPGDTVEFVIDGSIVHDLKGDEGINHKAASKFTVKHKYTEPGTFSYSCTIHPGMTGTVTVS